jgi:Zn-dependent protease with chaperone function
MAPTDIDARYFDGHQATAHAVALSIANGRVRVSGDGISRDDPIGGVIVSERIGRTPRFVRFADGAFCEVTNIDGLEAALISARVDSGAVSQWETSGRLVAILVVVMALGGAAAYWFGLPLLARGLADRLPTSALEGLSNQTLQILDGQVFTPSELTLQRQQALSARFALVRWPASAEIPMRVLHRKSEQLGANALALPSGTIVVTDELVALAKSDDEILAVLAHEAGHVQERHGLRSIIQSSAVSLLVTWLLGDVGSLVAVAPTALLQAKYSRDLERDADGYAAATLSGNGLSLGLLADILERMEEAHGGPTGRLAGAISYVSTHPATEERIDALRR